MGKVMPRYCNICNRLVTPREIEKGEAIVYGMHCYCSKCKQEVMPIIEALKKRAQKADTSSRMHKPKKPKLKKVARTQVFFQRRTPPRPKQEPPSKKAAPVPHEAEVVEATPVEVVEEKAVAAEAVEEPTSERVELEPVDFSKMGPAKEVAPLPPGAVKIGQKLIEVTPDGIRQEISPPRGPTVRPPAGKRPTTSRHLRRPARKEEVELPPPPAPTKPSRTSGTTIALILIVALIGGGLAYYLLIHRPAHRKPITQDTTPRGSQESQEVAKKLDLLRRRVEALSNPADWPPLKRQLRSLLIEADPHQRTRIHMLITQGDVWFTEQARSAWESAKARLKEAIRRASVDPSLIPQLKEALKMDEVFRDTPFWKEREKQLARIRKTEEVFGTYQKLRRRIEEKVKKRLYDEALSLLEEIKFKREEVIWDALAFLRRERERIERLRDERRRLEEARRAEAEREWERVKADAERMAARRKFDIALQFVRAFISAYAGTGLEEKARALLKKIQHRKTAWELSTLILQGTLRKGYWQTDDISVEKQNRGLRISAGTKEGRLLLTADLNNAAVLMRIRRLAGTPVLTIPKTSSKRLIEMASTLFPHGRDVTLKLLIRNRQLFYWIGTGQNLTPYAPEPIEGTDGLAIILPSGSSLLLLSVKVSR